MPNYTPETLKECLYCHKPFTAENVFTPDGWKEVAISGVCEKCFDDCTKEGEGDE